MENKQIHRLYVTNNSANHTTEATFFLHFQEIKTNQLYMSFLNTNEIYHLSWTTCSLIHFRAHILQQGSVQ